MGNSTTRRQVLSGIGGAVLAPVWPARAASAPSTPVAVAKCQSYGSELLPTLERMFDQIGGLAGIVKGKTVAIKLNLNALPTQRLGYVPQGESFWPHPNVIGATLHLMAIAGARRIRLLESTQSSDSDPLEEHLWQANWEIDDLLSAHPNVEFGNSNTRGGARHYVRFKVPGGGVMYPAYDLSQCYQDCDVFVSIAKLKDHPTTGVTLGMKNLFGITPRPVYKDRMQTLHIGKKSPQFGAPGEKDPTSPRHDGYRIPRILSEISLIRPTHLSILDGITGLSGAQKPGTLGTAQVKPGVLLVGTNIVNVDSVALGVMNYDPMADRGATPFWTCDNFLRVAEEAGLGTRDPRRIEIIGASVADAMFDFRTRREAVEALRKRQGAKEVSRARKRVVGGDMPS